MAGLCVPGLQGFPIQISEWNINNQKVLANDISLQFSPSQTTMDGVLNGQYTFFIGGSQYYIKQVRLSSPIQSGLSSVPAVAELHIWGYPTSNSTEKNTLALLNIPIFQGGINSDAGETFVKYLKNGQLLFKNIIPFGNDVKVIRYSTCVETDKNFTVNIKVAYWEKGLIISQENMRFIPQNLQKKGIPKMDSYKFLTTYEQSEGGKGNRIYNERDGELYTYPTSLSSTNTDVKNVFGYISGFTSQSKAENSTDLYKCVTIDKSRDIKDGKLLIDPSNGKRLTDSVEDANTIQAKLELQDVKYSPKKVITYIAIFIGTIFGIGLIILIGYYIYKFINSSGVDTSHVPEAGATAPRIKNNSANNNPV
jgi:hypothetical protein